MIPAQAEGGEEQAVQEDGTPGPDEEAVPFGSLHGVQEDEEDMGDSRLDDSSWE